MLLTEEIDSLMRGVTNLNTPPQIMSKVIKRITTGMEAAHKDQVCFRASSIGKPWILQVLGRWYPSEPVFSVGACMKMLDGIVAQGWAEEILDLAGHEFESEKELRLDLGGGTEVVGHSDMIVTNRATRQMTVIECKSMAGHVMSRFYATPHDDHGYLSQLSFYVTMVRQLNPTFTVEPLFLLFDRSNGQFRTVVLGENIVSAKFGRVSSALVDVAKIPMFDLDALLDTVMIPPPIGGQIPPSMKWSKWAKAFYYEGGDREVLMHTKERSKQLIENMTQNRIGAL
jgi:hypothetical protein